MYLQDSAMIQIFVSGQWVEAFFRELPSLEKSMFFFSFVSSQMDIWCVARPW